MGRHSASIEKLAQQVKAAADAANANVNDQQRLASFIDNPALPADVRDKFLARLKERRADYAKQAELHRELEDKLHHQMHNAGLQLAFTANLASLHFLKFAATLL